MENLRTQTDEQLACYFKATNSQEAISILLDRHKDAILKKCKGYVKQQDIAQDLCQEVMIKLFLKMKSYQNQSKFSTWLFAVIHNTAIDYLRKSKRSVENILVDKLKDKLPDLMEHELEISQEMSIQILEELLLQLTPEDRMLLIMKYREGHQIKDIQQTLGISESAIKMRLKRARSRIHKLHRLHMLKFTGPDTA